jgi:hypothetical protein
LTNQVLHDTDNPGSQEESVSADVVVSRKVFLPLIFKNYP